MVDQTAQGIQIPVKYKHELKVMPCRECGSPMKVGIRTRKAPRCIECGIAAQARHNTDLANHTGEAYVRWMESMRRYILSEGTATPPPAEEPPSPVKE